MNVQRHRKSLGAVAVCAALLLSACGTSGGDEDADPTTTTEAEETTTTEAEETTTTEAEVDDEAQARAESIDLTVSDFPDGWTATPAEPDDDEDSGVEQCTGESSDDDVIGEHATDDFILGDLSADDGVQVSIETKVFTDEAAAEAALEPFADEEVISCVDELFKEQFGTGGTTIEGTMGIEDYGDTAADQAEAASGQYTVTTAEGEEVILVVAVAVLRTGDVATQILVTGVGPTIEEADLEGVATRVEELQAAA